MLKSYNVACAHCYSYSWLFLQLIICDTEYIWTCDVVSSSGIELHKRAGINNAVGIAEEPIVYTKLSDAVNKKLMRDWDTVDARPE